VLSRYSPKEKRNWNDVAARGESHFTRLEMAGVKYAPSIYDPIITAEKKDTATVLISLSTEIDGLKIHYSFDNSFPDTWYPAYTEPLLVPKDAVTLKLITSREGKLTGRMMTIPVAELKKRAGIK
jgi:hexosaminidase